MQAGKLRHRVTIQQLVAGSPQQKATGEPDTTWTDFATLWADIRPLRGMALFAAQQQQSGAEVEIHLRYRSGVTADMRIVHSTTVYEIRSIDDTKRHEGRLILQCARGLNNG
jgi:SPP1 family predicted phage head-tail adaptor